MSERAVRKRFHRQSDLIILVFNEKHHILGLKRDFAEGYGDTVRNRTVEACLGYGSEAYKKLCLRGAYLNYFSILHGFVTGYR